MGETILMVSTIPYRGLKLGRDAASSVFLISNIILGVSMAKELMLVFLLFFFNDFSAVASCGLLSLVAMVYLLIYLIGIPLCIQMFRSGNKGDREKKGWSAAGAITAVGLVMPFAIIPFFPFMFVIAMYIFTYQVMEENRRNIFNISLFIYVTASAFTAGGLLVRDLTNIWIMGGLGIITVMMFIISHVQHISLNKGAARTYNSWSNNDVVGSIPGRRPSPVSKPVYSYQQQFSGRAAVTTSFPGVKKDALNKSAEPKPRVLEAPPGYD